MGGCGPRCPLGRACCVIPQTHHPPACARLTGDNLDRKFNVLQVDGDTVRDWIYIDLGLTSIKSQTGGRHRVKQPSLSIFTCKMTQKHVWHGMPVTYFIILEMHDVNFQ